MLDKEAVILTIKDILHGLVCPFMRSIYVFISITLVTAYTLSLFGVDFEEALFFSLLGYTIIIFVSIFLWALYDDNLKRVKKERWLKENGYKD